MLLSPVDRIQTLMEAKSMVTIRTTLLLTEQLDSRVRDLNEKQMFAISELSEFSGYTPYRIRELIRGRPHLVTRRGVYARHLDHLIRMVDSEDFTRKHIQSLLDDGATFAGISRTTGRSVTTLRRWQREEYND